MSEKQKIKNKAICKICNESIKEINVKDLKSDDYYHLCCFEKIKLLRKLKNANLLSEEEFKYVELFFELKLDWDDPGIEFDEIDNETDKLSKKYEIELDQEFKTQIDIISKALGMDPEDFIKFVLKNEIQCIKSYLNMSYPKENLEDYYKFEINIDELKKLNLVGEVLIMATENQNETIKIEIPIDISQGIDNLCKINNWDTIKKIIDILDTAVFSAEILDHNGFKQVINF